MFNKKNSPSAFTLRASRSYCIAAFKAGAAWRGWSENNPRVWLRHTLLIVHLIVQGRDRGVWELAR
jgi:hypothetical protein